MMYAIALIQGILVAAFIWVLILRRSRIAADKLKELRSVLALRDEIKAELEGLYSELVTIDVIKAKVSEVRSLNDSLKMERGRITITLAELETVEGRLRELEEIERELLASGLETKEELKILQKKENDLKTKNENLKTRLSESNARLDQLMLEIEMSAQLQEMVDKIKADLIKTEGKVDLLLHQISQCNERYVSMKQRYDALDIEYAQLYEKYAEVSGKG